MANDDHARGSVAMPTEGDKGPTVTAAAPQTSKESSTLHFLGVPYAGQAHQVNAAEAKARNYVTSLQVAAANPDELALVLFGLYCATLRGFCRLIGKAMGVRHG